MTLIHRDYHPENTLCWAGRLTGVVDWTQASYGPPALDVAHMRWNLAADHGRKVAVGSSVIGKRSMRPPSQAGPKALELATVGEVRSAISIMSRLGAHAARGRATGSTAVARAAMSSESCGQVADREDDADTGGLPWRRVPSPLRADSWDGRAGRWRGLREGNRPARVSLREAPRRTVHVSTAGSGPDRRSPTKRASSSLVVRVVVVDLRFSSGDHMRYYRYRI